MWFLFITATQAGAQATADAPAFDVDRAIAEAGFASDQVGYIVVDASTGAVLAERLADALFIPASVAKIPVTVAALHLLGADYRFRTEVLAVGPIRDGVLHGDLYLRGGGDPFLTADHLAAMVDDLRSAGVSRVDGRFFFDETLQNAVAEIEPAQPDTAAYNTGISALSLNFNIIQVRWGQDPADAGRLVEVTTNTDTLRIPVATVDFSPLPPDRPAAGFFTLDQEADGERWWLAPQLPSQGEDWLPVRRPAQLAASAFRHLCEEADIVLSAPEPGRVPEGAWLLTDHRSRPMVDIVRGVLRYSNNLTAELIGLAASRQLAGQPLGLASSGAMLADWLSTRLPGMAWDGFRLANHSGLTSQSRTSPRQMAEILGFVHDRPFGTSDYAGLLRTLPWQGELNADRAEADAPPVSIRAKSGTMNYARGLAGVIEQEDGRRLVFAVFVNDVAQRAALDGAAGDQAREITGSTRAWLARARALERDLVTHWVEAFSD